MKEKNLKRTLDVLIYFVAVLIDSVCFVYMLKIGLGTSPYGIFINALSIFSGATLGIVSFIFGFLQVYIASRFRKTRIKFELMLYSFVFAVFVDVVSGIAPDINVNGMIGGAIIMVLLIFILDISRALFELVDFPKLSFVELLVGMKERFGIDFKAGTRINNLLLFTIALPFSYFQGNIFEAVGIGTFLTLILSGVGHQLYSPIVKLMYLNVTKKLIPITSK